MCSEAHVVTAQRRPPCKYAAPALLAPQSDFHKCAHKASASFLRPGCRWYVDSSGDATSSTGPVGRKKLVDLTLSYYTGDGDAEGAVERVLVEHADVDPITARD